jgi:hypothetical protein
MDIILRNPPCLDLKQVYQASGEVENSVGGFAHIVLIPFVYIHSLPFNHDELCILMLPFLCAGRGTPLLCGGHGQVAVGDVLDRYGAVGSCGEARAEVRWV